MKNKGYELALTSVCVMLGALLMVQLKTQQNLRVSLPTNQASDLALMLRDQEKARVSLEQEIQQVRLERRRQNAQEQLSRLKMQLGLTPLIGPGLEVRLALPAGNVTRPDGSSGNYIDPAWVDTVINELWAAGAEAVSINGERVVTSTGLGSAPSGPGVIVNGKVVTPPFTILAIGDAVTLDSALRMRNSAVDLLKYWDLEVTLIEHTSVTVPASKLPLHYSYIRVPGFDDRR